MVYDTPSKVSLIQVIYENLLVTRPKPAYGWQGLELDPRARIQFGRAIFGVFSTSHFVPPSLSSDWILLIAYGYSLGWDRGVDTFLEIIYFWCKNVTLPTQGPD